MVNADHGVCVGAPIFVESGLKFSASLPGDAITLRDCLDRAEDRCCRWGGDEFVVLLPSTDREGALQVADRALNAAKRAGKGEVLSC